MQCELLVSGREGDTANAQELHFASITKHSLTATYCKTHSSQQLILRALQASNPLLEGLLTSAERQGW